MSRRCDVLCHLVPPFLCFMLCYSLLTPQQYPSLVILPSPGSPALDSSVMSTPTCSKENVEASIEMVLDTRKAFDIMEDSTTKASSQIAIDATEVVDDDSPNCARGLRFWMIIFAIMVSSFIIAVDLVRYTLFFVPPCLQAARSGLEPRSL